MTSLAVIKHDALLRGIPLLPKPTHPSLAHVNSRTKERHEWTEKRRLRRLAAPRHAHRVAAPVQHARPAEIAAPRPAWPGGAGPGRSRRGHPALQRRRDGPSAAWHHAGQVSNRA